jgi:phosphoribosylanthranilate isomerase
VTHRTRIKICGITRVEDAVAAATLGADAIGLVFWARSPRAVDIETARRIALSLPPLVARVALFVDPDEAEVRAVLDALPVEWLQFHGGEPASFCSGFARPYLKAIPVAEGATPADLLEYAARHPGAQGVLLDALKPGALPGGTGEAFDWTVVPAGWERRLILSGGLHSGNVAAAVRTVRPWGVDVSTGVEALGEDGRPKRGIKDPARIAEFIRGVRDADA